MAGRVPQPPVNPLLRPTEARDFWPGAVLILVAAALLLTGTWHLTRVNTTEAGGAWEFQLVKAFTCGGLQAKSAVAVPDLAAYEDPSAAAAALERMARQQANTFPITYRVNTSAAAPCPT